MIPKVSVVPPVTIVDCTLVAPAVRARRAEVCRSEGLGPIFQKLQSTVLEKAPAFLDDRLLASTSNAVEPGNRRHREMRKENKQA